MPLLADFKPSHESRFRFAIANHGAIGRFFNEFMANLDDFKDWVTNTRLDLSKTDLTKVEQPFVQQILRRLAIKPNPREWLLDKGLSKSMRNQLVAHHLIKLSVLSFFDELKALFFLRQKSIQDMKASLASKQRAIAREAYFAQLYANDRHLKELHDEEIKKLLEQYNQQNQLISQLEHDLAMLDAAKDVMLQQAAAQFLVFVRQDKQLNAVFASANDSQVEAFAKVYVDKCSDYQCEIDRLKQEKAQAKAESNAQKAEQLKAQKREYEQKLENVHEEAAQECELGRDCRDQLAQEANRKRVKERLKPEVDKVVVVKKQIASSRLELAMRQRIRFEMNKVLPIAFRLPQGELDEANFSFDDKRKHPLVDLIAPPRPKLKLHR